MNGPSLNRFVLLLALVSALALAGCNGFTLSGDGTPAPTLTPAAVPTDRPTPTPVPQLAPGLTGKGVTDAFALGAAHAAVLDNTSFTMQEDSSVTYQNGTNYRQYGTDARVAANESRYYVVQNTSGETDIFNNQTFISSIWSNGTRVLVARTINGNTSYNVPRGADREPLPPRQMGLNPTNREQIYTIFSSVETRVTGREQRNGTTLYRVVATNVTNPVAFERPGRNPRNLTFRALISPRGLVREYRLNYTATLNNTTVHVHRHVRYTDLGNTTIERPPWYDDAIENATTPGGTSRGH